MIIPRQTTERVCQIRPLGITDGKVVEAGRATGMWRRLAVLAENYQCWSLSGGGERDGCSLLLHRLEAKHALIEFESAFKVRRAQVHTRNPRLIWQAKVLHSKIWLSCLFISSDCQFCAKCASVWL